MATIINDAVCVRYLHGIMSMTHMGVFRVVRWQVTEIHLKMKEAKGGLTGLWDLQETWTTKVQEGPWCDQTLKTTGVWDLDTSKTPSLSTISASPHVQTPFLTAHQIVGIDTGKTVPKYPPPQKKNLKQGIY